MNLPRVHFLDSSVQMPASLVLPVRCVLFELSEARVLLGPGTRLRREQLEQVGPVTDIVATSLTHASGVKQAAEVFPDARRWGPVGIREKYPELTWHGVLGEDPWPHERELSHHRLHGQPKLNESVFLHHASKTLYVSDLAFNITEPRGLAAAILFRLFGTYRRFAVSRIFLRYCEDRAALARSVQELIALDFEHVIPAHGEPALNNGKARLEAALKERSLLR
ncbi:MAG: hypothetical protein IRZ16_11290 [Myxococcaceae bacterium]|nr:hypothetical protein [Myxococcaceae bacterium]